VFVKLFVHLPKAELLKHRKQLERARTSDVARIGLSMLRAPVASRRVVETMLEKTSTPEAVRAWVATRGAAASAIASLRAMVVAPSGERMLVELKAVDGAYPLYGALALDPPVALAPGTVALDPLVAGRLGLHPGDMVRIGEARLRVAALVAGEPDKVATPALFGPRAMIAAETLAATALIQPGSMVSHELRIRLPAGADPRAEAAALRRDFRAEGWRVRTADAAEPGLNRFLDRAAAFLTLAGFVGILLWHVPRLDLGAVIAVTLILAAVDLYRSAGERDRR
jgi:predicted lysophospholipase L1 biosynthesis ABC-type transport system permease subunit